MEIWWLDEGTKEGDISFFVLVLSCFLDLNRRYREKFRYDVRLSSENLAMRMVLLVISFLIW
jgi:hypothetical protein